MKHLPQLVPFFLLALVALTACSKDPRQPEGFMDTPLHHHEVAMSALDQGELDVAAEEFTRALELDENYGPALAGQGLLLARQGKGPEPVLDRIFQGRREAETPAEKLETLVMNIRAYTQLARFGHLGASEALKRCQAPFDKGMDLAADSAALHFHMAEAHLRALEFAGAAGLYARVKELGGRYASRAESRWELMQQALRAAPGTQVGRRIVLEETVTRGDMAALLVHELDIPLLFEEHDLAQSRGFRTPESHASPARTMVPPDVRDHAQKNDILQVLEYGIQGLSPGPDGRFHPFAPLSRGELALVIQDLLVVMSKDPGLATRYAGRDVPFTDIRSDHYMAGALMLAVSRGFLHADRGTGAVRPFEPVSGVKALLAVRQLRAELSRF
jgi:tetratricopeptide (TPR) repeat protein